jgi:protein SCO1
MVTRVAADSKLGGNCSASTRYRAATLIRVHRLLLLLASVVLAVVAGCGGTGGSAAAQEDASPFRSEFEGAEFGTPKQLADFALRDQRGDVVRFSSQQGKVVLVTFLYTNCPDVCPLIAENLNGALRELGSDRDSVRVLAVSVDPQGDTPKRVRSYARRHHLQPEFHYLIGSQQELSPVWKAYDVTAIARNPELVDHSAFTLLVDRKGLARAVYDATVRSKAVVHDVRLLLAD